MERINYKDIPHGMFEKLRAVEDFISNSTLDVKLLGTIRLRASQANGCAYCVGMHHRELKHLGESDLRLSSLCVWEDASCFSEKERTVLRFVDALTELNRSPISEVIYTPLLNFFSKEDICYLTLSISQINTWNRLMKTFDFTPGHHKTKK